MSNKIAGNPKIVATNGKYNIIKRGSKYYAVLEIGKPLSNVKKWKTKSLLSQMLIKGGYREVEPPKDYTE